MLSTSYLPLDDEDQQDQQDFVNAGIDSPAPAGLPGANDRATNDPGPTPGANAAVGAIDLGDTSTAGGSSTVFGQPVDRPGTRRTLQMGDLEAIQGARPPRPGSVDPATGEKTKGIGFWRNLAAIGAGLASGYANSANPRGPRVDVGSVMDNIKFGGYNRKLEEWQNQEADAKAQLNMTLKGEAADIANDKDKSTTNLQNAEANHANAAADALKNPKPVRPVAQPKNEYEQRNEMATQLGLDRKDPKNAGMDSVRQGASRR